MKCSKCEIEPQLYCRCQRLPFCQDHIGPHLLEPGDHKSERLEYTLSTTEFNLVRQKANNRMNQIKQKKIAIMSVSKNLINEIEDCTKEAIFQLNSLCQLYLNLISFKNLSKSLKKEAHKIQTTEMKIKIVNCEISSSLRLAYGQDLVIFVNVEQREENIIIVAEEEKIMIEEEQIKKIAEEKKKNDELELKRINENKNQTKKYEDQNKSEEKFKHEVFELMRFIEEEKQMKELEKKKIIEEIKRKKEIELKKIEDDKKRRIELELERKKKIAEENRINEELVFKKIQDERMKKEAEDKRLKNEFDENIRKKA